MAKGKQIVNLRAFRKEVGATQEEVAKILDIDQRQWSRYETGKNDIPLHYFIKICRKYKVSADWVINLPIEEGGE